MDQVHWHQVYGRVLSIEDHYRFNPKTEISAGCLPDFGNQGEIITERQHKRVDKKMNKPLAPLPFDIATVVADVRRLLEYHLGAGIEQYPATKEVRGLLEMRAITRSGVKSSGPVDRPITAQAGTGERHREIKPIRDPRPSAATLNEIRVEVEGCQACSLSQVRVVPVSGDGVEAARLMIVGDWLRAESGQTLPESCIFGVEQDRMLGKMLEAIRLDRKEVFVTNVIKCGIGAASQPQAEHVEACLSYLHRQLAALRPAAILCMGMIATRALLNRREPLSRLRGQLHILTLADGRTLPLIATYHPTFLLQNPEMKKATWLDLQLLAKQLGLPQV